MAYRRPVIGIPCGLYPDAWFTPTNGNAISYLRAIEAAGGIPSLIHLTRDAEVLDALYHNKSTARHDMAHLAHPIALEADSWLAGRLDTCDLVVNTLHHQALRDLAPGLRVVARAPDGLIEAVEGTGAGLIVGVQCHPEELWELADRRWARVFAEFVEVAAEFFRQALKQA